jgi:hypothetical protein
MFKQVGKFKGGCFLVIILGLLYSILKTVVVLAKLLRVEPTQVLASAQTPEPVQAPPRISWLRRSIFNRDFLVFFVSSVILLNLLVPGYWALSELFIPPLDSPVPSAPLPPNAVRLGEPNFFEYCQAEFGGIPFARAWRPNAFSLRCRLVEISVLPNTIFYAISVNEACSQQYGAPAYGRAFNPNDPYGWECWRYREESTD